MPLRWVCFDVGETLIDETRVWSTWADVLGITRLTFMAGLGAVISRREPHQAVFDLVGRSDWRERSDKFRTAYGGFRPDDLYPDAVESIHVLRATGYHVAVLANQPAHRTLELRAVGIEADVMAMSEELGVHKPSTDFYRRALELMEADPSDVAYVGDRLDNDVRPAAGIGMRPVWVRRGPWALIERETPPPGTLVVGSLVELIERIFAPDGSFWP